MTDTSEPSRFSKTIRLRDGTMATIESRAEAQRMNAITTELADHDAARVLDPIDRVSEMLFGLFMVLTFTGTLSVLDSGRDEVRSMPVAAIGCNLA